MEAAEIRVFVYGTLKPGGRYWPEYCEGRVESVQPAKVNGRLFDLHLGYPGLVLGGDDWVQGVVLTFSSPQDLAQLDELEGYRPDRDMSANEYLRLWVDVVDLDENPLGRVWIYEITDSVLKRSGGTLIKGGNWVV